MWISEYREGQNPRRSLAWDWDDHVKGVFSRCIFLFLFISKRQPATCRVPARQVVGLLHCVRHSESHVIHSRGFHSAPAQYARTL